MLLALYAFYIQIYCDFSGYTDIARGLAKLMGFEFMINFDRPYLAAGPREFWTRWHISLSTWLRDYLYRPLGGNRLSRPRLYANVMITMLIGGVWHGAAWTFLLWGLYHGLLLMASRAFGDSVSTLLPRWVRAFFFFHLTCFGWLIFRAGNLQRLAMMTEALLQPFGKLEAALAPAAILLAFAALMSVLLKRLRGMEVRAACYAVLLYLILFRGGNPQSFIYFQF